MWIGKITMVSGREIEEVEGVLTNCDNSEKIVILMVSQAVIATMKKADKMGKSKTRKLSIVMSQIEGTNNELGTKAVSFELGKSYMGIKSNKDTEKKAKEGVK